MSNAVQQRKYYADNPEKFREKSREFRKNNPQSARASVSKWHKNNPERVRELGKESYQRLRKNNPELAKRRARANKLWTKYRITLEQEQQMLKEQKHCCKICKKSDMVVGKLVPDHNHETNRVRGMLCDGCNRGLGQARESIKILEAMIAYLKEDQAHEQVRRSKQAKSI